MHSRKASSFEAKASTNTKNKQWCTEFAQVQCQAGTENVVYSDAGETVVTMVAAYIAHRLRS